MTDLPEHETHEDRLLLDAIDGDEASRATVAADPRLAALFAAMTSNRDSLVSAEFVVDQGVRAGALATALSVFDDMQASAAGAEAVAAVKARQRRSLRLFRSAGAIAASAAVVVGIVAIAPNLSPSGSDDSATIGDAAATTAAPAATTAAASAAPESARAATTTAAAAATTVADSISTTTEAPAESAAEAPVAGDSDEGPLIDARLLECAELLGIETTMWVTSTAVVPQPGTGPYVQIAVLLDDGLEIIVTYDPAACDVNSITDPAPPGEGGQ